MRLIDADALKEVFTEHFDAYFNENGQLMYSDHIRTRDDVSDLFNVIDKQPTDYDVDGVVAQLGDYGNEEMDYCRNTPYEKCIEECVHKAIEIVKAGGKCQ